MNTMPLLPNSIFLDRMDLISKADYLILDKKSEVQVTTALPFYFEKFKELFGLSDKANPKKIEAALVKELKDNKTQVTSEKSLQDITKIAKKCHLILNDPKSVSKHYELAILIQEIKINVNNTPVKPIQLVKSTVGLGQLEKKPAEEENIIKIASLLQVASAPVEAVVTHEQGKEKTLGEEQNTRDNETLEPSRFSPIVTEAVRARSPSPTSSSVKTVSLPTSTPSSEKKYFSSTPLITRIVIPMLAVAGAGLAYYFLQSAGRFSQPAELIIPELAQNASSRQVIQDLASQYTALPLDLSLSPVDQTLEFLINVTSSHPHTYKILPTDQLNLSDDGEGGMNLVQNGDAQVVDAQQTGEQVVEKKGVWLNDVGFSPASPLNPEGRVFQSASKVDPKSVDPKSIEESVESSSQVEQETPVEQKSSSPISLPLIFGLGVAAVAQLIHTFVTWSIKGSEPSVLPIPMKETKVVRIDPEGLEVPVKEDGVEVPENEVEKASIKKLEGETTKTLESLIINIKSEGFNKGWSSEIIPGVVLGRAPDNDAIWFFQNQEAFGAFRNPSKGVSIAYHSQTKELLLNGLPIETQAEAQLVKELVETLKNHPPLENMHTEEQSSAGGGSQVVLGNRLRAGVEHDSASQEDNSELEEHKIGEKFNALAQVLTKDRKAFALKRGIEEKADLIRNQFSSKNEIKELKRKVLKEGFKIAVSNDGFVISSKSNAEYSLRIEYKDGLVTVNGHTDRSFEQDQLVYDFLNCIQDKRPLLNLPTRLAKALETSSTETEVFVTPPEIKALTLKDLTIPSLTTNIERAQLVEAIREFKKVVLKPGLGTRTFRDSSFAIGHRDDGLFYIQSNRVFGSRGKVGSESISIDNNGKLCIGHLENVTQEQLNAAYGVLQALVAGDAGKIADAFLLLKAANATSFEEIRSAKLVDIPIKSPMQESWFKVDGKDVRPRDAFRDYYTNNPQESPPACVITTSDWFPTNMVLQYRVPPIFFSEHLMGKKKGDALGVKWKSGDQITNMEAAMHSFFVPVSHGVMPVDALWIGAVKVSNLEAGMGRPYVLSTAIQPDLEGEGPDSVILKLCGLGDREVQGKQLDEKYMFPSPEQKQDDSTRNQHDLVLEKHMISKLYSKQIKPSANEVKKYDHQSGKVLIEKAILSGKPEDLIGQAISVGGKTISLEAMFNFYKEQLACELLALEAQCPQGYIFTIDPPAVFIKAIGGGSNAAFLNRLQGLAMKMLIQEGRIQNMKAVAFNGYADKEMISIYQDIMESSKIKVYHKIAVEESPVPGLFSPQGKCLIDDSDPAAIVLHNNSDGFGYNLLNETCSSTDGLIGCLSNFSSTYEPTRDDLTRHIFTQKDWLHLRELEQERLSG